MKKITLFLTVVLFAFQSNAQVIYSNTFDSALGGTVAHPTGSSTNSGWARVVTGTFPTCSTFSGTGMARFNSYNIVAGNSYSLTFPQITFTGANYRVKFNMYRDGGYPTDADKVRVYYKTLTTDAGTLIGTVNRSKSLAPTVDADGWYSYSFDIPGSISGTGYIMLLGSSFYGTNIFVDNLSVEQIPSMDAQMLDFSINEFLEIGSYPINGSIKNFGLNTITSADVNWQVDGGVINTQSLTGLNITSGQTYNFTHQTNWTTIPGQHSVSLWVSNTNEADQNSSNDAIVKNIYVVNEIFPRTVVYEEGTGTWCQFCPRGAVGLKNMTHDYPDSFIGIAVHNADPMTLTEYDARNDVSGYPSGLINRSASEVDPGLQDLVPAYQSELAKTPLCKVQISNQSWNPTTRLISFDAEAIFALDITNSNYKFAAVIIEDSVTGTTSGYAQVNAYSGGGLGPLVDFEGTDWTALPNPVPAATMVYDHVGRALLGGYDGVAGSIPSNLTYNVPVSHTFTHTLPANQNAEHIEIVALVLDASGKIANAKKVELDTTLATTNFSKSKISVYPNPSTGELKVTTEVMVNVELIDVLGKVVFSAKNVTNETVLNISSLQKGLYLAKIAGENGIYTDKIILK